MIIKCKTVVKCWQWSRNILLFLWFRLCLTLKCFVHGSAGVNQRVYVLHEQTNTSGTCFREGHVYFGEYTCTFERTCALIVCTYCLHLLPPPDQPPPPYPCVMMTAFYNWFYHLFLSVQWRWKQGDHVNRAVLILLTFEKVISSLRSLMVGHIANWWPQKLSRQSVICLVAQSLSPCSTDVNQTSGKQTKTTLLARSPAALCVIEQLEYASVRESDLEVDSACVYVWLRF